MGVEPKVTFEIAGRAIGAGHACFVIAEAGVNHNGDLRLAMRLVEAAADAGADAVKFQTFNADRLVTRSAPKARYQQDETGGGESQHAMLKALELPPDAFRQIQARCQELGILFLSTPFDDESVDLLDALAVPAFKVGSGELTNLALLRHVASRGKPVILSTGMSTMAEVAEAVTAVRGSGNRELALLHCVSSYPAPPGEVNLRAMAALEAAFHVPVGYSDHTVGMAVPLAAVALGAAIIEKHFTLDPGLPGPDHRFSSPTDELAALVRGIRIVESALGNARKQPVPSEADTARVARRSLVAARAIPAGVVITDDLIAVQRPGTGLPPSMRRQIVGRTARTPIQAGELLSLEMFS